MKIISAALALAVLSFGTIHAAAQDRQVRIVNDTSFTIVEFYASSTGTQSWEEDILGSEVLAAGSSVMINIDDGSGYCKYDFLAVFDDGEQVTSGDNNVCELAEFSFSD